MPFTATTFCECVVTSRDGAFYSYLHIAAGEILDEQVGHCIDCGTAAVSACVCDETLAEDRKLWRDTVIHSHVAPTAACWLHGQSHPPDVS